VRVPFDDFLGTTRLDWSQSPRSQWFLRGAMDSYLTNNSLVQQATLPSTGATMHANYFNVVLSNQFCFHPYVAGIVYFHCLHAAQHSDWKLGLWLRAGVSFQRDLFHHLGIRDLRRPAVPDAYHCLPGSA
jgi:hypothetical protein